MFSLQIGNAQPVASGEIRQIITAETGVFMSPKFSSDGNQILLTGMHYSGLYTYSLKDNQIKLLTNDVSVGFGATWVDSYSILVRHSIRDGNYTKHAVGLLNLDGELNLLTDYIHSMPSIPVISSSKNQIYYQDKQELKEVASGFPLKSSPSKRPDFIAVGNQIKKIGKSTNSEILTAELLTEEADILNLQISADGNRMVFEVLGGHLICFDVSKNTSHDLGSYYRPSFSPDGNWIVAMQSTDDGHEILTSEIVALKYDGTTKVELTSTFSPRAMNPNWSPKGDAIVFDSPDTGAIYIIPITNEGN